MLYIENKFRNMKWLKQRGYVKIAMYLWQFGVSDMLSMHGVVGLERSKSWRKKDGGGER